MENNIEVGDLVEVTCESVYFRSWSVGVVNYVHENGELEVVQVLPGSVATGAYDTFYLRLGEKYTSRLIARRVGLFIVSMRNDYTVEGSQLLRNALRALIEQHLPGTENE
jgi:hypothetical protein